MLGLAAASVFGELWKLEPLPEERKNKWQREMDWLLSPTNYMIELVPAKQSGTNGRTLEVYLIYDSVQYVSYLCHQVFHVKNDHHFWFGADNDAKSSCRYSHESTSTPEIGFYASCRWSLNS